MGLYWGEVGEYAGLVGLHPGHIPPGAAARHRGQEQAWRVNARAQPALACRQASEQFRAARAMPGRHTAEMRAHE